MNDAPGTATTGTGPFGRTDQWWSLCAGCCAIVYGPRLARGHHVCPECGRHERLTADQRIAMLFDEGSTKPLDLSAATGDPLEFTDTVPYPVRLRQAREATGLDEAVVCVRGEICGNPVIAAVMDFRFMGGSLGGAVGELVAQAADEALHERVPLLIVTASGGARMQEGAVALMQMAKTSRALGALDEAGVLTVSLVTDPTFGGVAASFATLCDVILAEPGARLGFAGRRVIEQTIKQRLPDDFQTAEFLLESGMVDAVPDRTQLRQVLGRLMALGGGRSKAVRRAVDGGREGPPAPPAAGGAWEVVRNARDTDRPTSLDYFSRILDTFVELHGDRMSGDCPAIVGGLGRLGGRPVVVMGHQKGHTASELSSRNFGMPLPSGYRKSARLLRLAAKLGLPVLTLVDTPGAYPGKEAEEHGQAIAIAENLRLMSGLPVPVVAVITGEGGSGGALALGVADRVLALSNAVYSVISPEGCAAILWKDPAAKHKAADALQADAQSLVRLGVADGVIPEPGNAQDAPSVMAERMQAAVEAAFDELSEFDGAQIVERRTKRFRSFQSRT